ncbi:MAG: PilZ domain-containing protein [Treponema sp.]|jgi:hypothetical protein|nr:PilZ domain-containing protein [Treponema sp.]
MLFFKERTAEPSDFKEKLREPRYKCVVFVNINGFEGEAVLSNINTGGYCMESRTYAALAPGDRHIMQIRPEPHSGIKPFEMEVEVRWIKSTETRFSAGFLVMERPVDRSFEKYIEYVKGRS